MTQIDKRDSPSYLEETRPSGCGKNCGSTRARVRCMVWVHVKHGFVFTYCALVYFRSWSHVARWWWRDADALRQRIHHGPCAVARWYRFASTCFPTASEWLLDYGDGASALELSCQSVKAGSMGTGV